MNHTRKLRTLLAALAALFLTGTLHAQVPALINYQGRVAVDGVNFDGAGQFKFALVDGGVDQNVQATAFAMGGDSVFFIGVINGGSGYTADPAVTITDATGSEAAAVATIADGVVTNIQVTNGGSGYSPSPIVTIATPPPNIQTTSFWNNDGTGAGPADEPATAVELPVTRGLYSVLLGDITIPNMAAIAPSFGVFNRPDLRLRVWFNDGVNGFQLLTPDQRLAPAAYLADGAVTSSTIADGAIVAAKIAPAAINGTHLAPGSLDFSHLTVPAAPGVGQVLGFDGIGLSWTTGVGGGDSVFSRNLANDVYYNGGNVGIGTASPTAKLDIRGSLTLEAGGSPGLFTGTGSAELNRYLVLINSPTSPSASGLKAGGILVSNDYSYGNPAKSDLIVKGSVMIGTATPASQTKLTIQTSPGLSVAKWGLEQTDGTVRLATFVGNGGYRTGLGTRSNHPLSLFTNDGDPSLTVSTAGNVGIGTDSPQAKLHLSHPTSVSHRIETTGGTNAWALVEFRNANGGWNIGTSRNFNGDQFYIARAGAAPVFSVQPNGDTYTQGTMACKVLTIRGADVAEPFDIAEEDLPKGTVVVIDETRHGGLRRSTVPYDTCVAGIVSGANGVDSGIILSQPGVNEGGQNVAISGRVYVQADATGAPIKPGDLLTTSDTPGHAMKVTEHARAQGAVLGKAMSSLNGGTGMVLVLVTLQ